METLAHGEPTGFGALLRRARTGAGLTQEALAERARSSVRTIQDLERGAHRPQRRTLDRLIQALGLGGRDKAIIESSALPAPRHLRVVPLRPRPVMSLQP